MQKETSTESMSRERMERYRALAMAFSYPDEALFKSMPDLDRAQLRSEYDRLFRAREIWLYEAEYLAKHQFQRSTLLADISGFYRAFGVQADRERPDALPAELEFMHFLIFKRLHALDSGIADAEGKADICRDAEKKFFSAHLLPAARLIAERILSEVGEGFYSESAGELLRFMESEERHFGGEAA